MEQGLTSRYECKKAVEILDSVDTGLLPAQRSKSSGKGSSKKTSAVSQKIQVNNAEKCQTMDHYGNITVGFESDGHESEADGV